MVSLARRPLILLLQLAAVFMLSGLTVVGSAGPALACSCSGGGLKAHAANAEAIVTGTPTALSEGDGSGLHDATLTVEVKRVYRGDVDEKLYVKTSSQGSACGWDPEFGREMHIFLYFEEGNYATNMCSGNTVATEANTRRLVALTGEAMVPTAGTTGEPAPSGVAAVLAAPEIRWALAGLGGLALVGALVYLVRRRPRATT